jgi:hypothetical protein
MSTFFSRRNPLFSSANRSSVLAFNFFHSLLGFGRGGETGGVDPPADPAAPSRDLYFPPAVFMLLDGEGFILQVHRVSLAFARGLQWWLLAVALLDLRWQCALAADSRQYLPQMAASVWGENP